MAEFLIKATNATHADPVKDRRGCYKRGDIVQVFPDGACTEQPSPNSNMVIIKVVGLSFEAAQKYMLSEMDTVDPRKTLTRRKFRIRVDDVPVGVRNTLRDERWITLDWAQVRNFLRNKITNTDET